MCTALLMFGAIVLRSASLYSGADAIGAFLLYPLRLSLPVLRFSVDSCAVFLLVKS